MRSLIESTDRFGLPLEEAKGIIPSTVGKIYTRAQVAEHWKIMSGNESDDDFKPPFQLTSDKYIVRMVHPKDITAHYRGYLGKDKEDIVRHGFGDTGKHSSDNVAHDYREGVSKAPPVILKAATDGKHKFETIDGVHRVRAAYLEGIELPALVPLAMKNK